jgi:predicted Zn-dependent protease
MLKILKSKIYFLLILTFIASCAKNPVSGMPDFVTITEQQEVEMGRAYHKEILKNSKILDNKELTKYYVELGEKIARSSHRPDLNWKFTIIDDPTFNAFATPGGYVYFYRGLLAHFNSEAELAGVLSHEIAHITARHAVRGMSTAQVTNLLIGLAASSVPGGSISNSGFNLLNQIVNKGYSRKYESEADNIAKEYLGRNGYNQNAMANFLKTMKSADDLENEIAKKEGRPISAGYHSIFSTHPSTENRIEAMNQTESMAGKKNKDAFLKMIDGLPYGTSDDEGYMRYNTFYHPFFAIKFSIPKGWELKNLPDKLIITNKESEIVLISDNLLRDDIENGFSPKDYLDQNIDKTSFLSTNELIEQKPLNKNKMSGYTYLYKTSSMVGITYTRYSVFFDIHQEDKKPKAWIFVKKFKEINDDNTSKVIETSFQKMTEEEVSKSQGLRIKVVRFREGMSYKELADNSPLGRYAEGRLRLLNGHYPEGTPEVGTLIKIVE